MISSLEGAPPRIGINLEKSVYIAMSTDFLHDGHLNIINKARSLGRVTVGVIADEATAAYKRAPLFETAQRVRIFENLKGIEKVVLQKTVSYAENLFLLKPDYVVHGDDWQTGPLSEVRAEVVEILARWGGQLIDVPYTHALSSQKFLTQIRKTTTTPDLRLKSLKRLLEIKPLVRILEAHNGLTGLLIENTVVPVRGEFREFDGMWESSLTDSASKGKPDTATVDVSSRLSTIDQILDVTTKPMIVDGDNGGAPEHFAFTVRSLERLGVSGVIIEDKIGVKRNSLFATEAQQMQDSVEDFCTKIATGKRVQVTDEFMIFARIESLILNRGMEDALDRAMAYVRAGADGILIHSAKTEPTEVLEFCKRYSALRLKAPLVVIPSTYSEIYEKDLIQSGVKMVIYANHLLRSAFPAMKKTIESILTHGRCHEASQECLPIKEIIRLIPAEL